MYQKIIADSIDVDEFLEVVRGQTAQEDKSLEEMRGAFRLFDKEGKGWISLKDLRQVLREKCYHYIISL